MSLVERFKNSIGVGFYHLMYWNFMVKPQVELFRKFYGPQFPNVERLASKSPLVFINADEMLEFPRPTLNKIVYIGGAHVQKSEPLDEKWEKIANESKQGLFVISFGAVANASHMPLPWRVSFRNKNKNIVLFLINFFSLGNIFKCILSI